MEPPPGGTGTGPAGPAGRPGGAARLRGVSGWLPGPAAAARGLRGERGARPDPPGRPGPRGDPEGVTGPGPPPLPGRISWAFPSLLDGTPSPGAWGTERRGAPGHPAMQATLEKPEFPEVTHLGPAFQGPSCRGGTATATTPRSREEDARQARGCDTPFPLNEGLAVRPEAEQVSVQVAWRRGREDHSEEGGGAGE